MSKLVLVVAALLALCAAARPVCHNITGTCTGTGFECVSGEVVTHAQRCDGVEDCSDGTDELLCGHADHRPISERAPEERQALQQGSCVNCNCAVTAYNVASSSLWFPFARVAPTDIALMTGTGASAGLPCNSVCVTTLTVGFYKKNRFCRGNLCCARQRACVTCSSSVPCSQSSTAARCY